jgi:hypothetical protein
VVYDVVLAHWMDIGSAKDLHPGVIFSEMNRKWGIEMQVYQKSIEESC